MLFNCTVSYNTTDEYAYQLAADTLSKCCPEPTTVDVFTSYCATANTTALSACLDAKGAYLDACELTGLKLKTAQAVKSSATRRRPSSHLSTFVLGLLGLTVLGFVSAAPTQSDASNTVSCSTFKPFDSSRWEMDRATPEQRISDTVDCTTSQTGCMMFPSSQPSWTASFQSPNPINITADINSVIKTAGKSYVASIAAPGFDSGLILRPGVKGHIAAWAGAIQIPGQFSGCTDGKLYTGEANILDPARFGVKIILEPTLAQMSFQEDVPQSTFGQTPEQEKGNGTAVQGGAPGGGVGAPGQQPGQPGQVGANATTATLLTQAAGQNTQAVAGQNTQPAVGAGQNTQAAGQNTQPAAVNTQPAAGAGQNTQPAAGQQTTQAAPAAGQQTTQQAAAPAIQQTQAAQQAAGNAQTQPAAAPAAQTTQAAAGP